VAEQVGALAGEVVAPAQQVSRRTHLGGVDVGHWERAAAHEGGDLERVDAVVLGLPPVDGFHV